EPLADVVIGVALQSQRHAARHERAKALARGAVEVQLDRVLRQSFGSMLPRNLAADDRADDSIDIADAQRALDLFTALDRRLTNRQERRHIERLVEPVV